jgi:hypothetical protein
MLDMTKQLVQLEGGSLICYDSWRHVSDEPEYLPTYPRPRISLSADVACVIMRRRHPWSVHLSYFNTAVG